MNREQLLSRIDQKWQQFVEAYQGLAEQYVLEPGVVGEWSVKDLMSHIATWEEEAVAALGLFMQGGRPPRYASYGVIDAFNARKWQEHRALSPVRAWQRFHENHHRLIVLLATVPEDHYATETRFRRRLRLDTYGHYSEHRRQILAWRQSRGL